ncbi:MAG: hypothetical protein V4662_17240 [Verrucomicrobiota bacterium]
MLFLRLILLLACLGSAAWYVDREQRAGRFQHVDDLFLDVLVANARERLSQPVIDEKDSSVAFIAIKEEQRGEYASWPPPPLDWQTLLKGLQPYDPSVLVIAMPLSWGTPAPEFVPAVKDALLPFTSVVFGVETRLVENKTAPSTPPFMGDLEDALPHFQRVDGEVQDAQALSALIAAPDTSFRASGELGLLAVTSKAGTNTSSLPYALRAENKLLPGVLAQTFARLTNSPYALHRLRLGPGGGAYLAEGTFVPLQNDASLAVTQRTQVPVINALDLMTGTLADALSAGDKAALGQSKVIVIGLDHEANETPRLAYLHAQAIADTLRLPRLQKLTEIQQWIAWGIAALAAAWIVLRTRRTSALWRGIGFVFIALVTSFLAFHFKLLWCPPTMPVALIAVGALVGRIAGRGRPKEAPAATPAPESMPDPAPPIG